MGGDYSRRSFDPKNHFSGVLMQQGRVQLDADWNEMEEISDRHWRAETIDVVGRCGVPKETPHGFEIAITNGALTIDRGRIYVDGLLAENQGEPPLAFDPILAETQGSTPLPYIQQPYLPNLSPSLPIGRHLVYLDVWPREVTFLEAPALIEKAVGIDTTTRRQTVWQVKLLADVGTSATCDTPDAQIPGWLDEIRPSAGRLSTGDVEPSEDDDPCLIPPSGGYRGLENHLYRVEIHDGGVIGTATFKWSSDNGSIVTAITSIPDTDKVVVAQLQWDSIRRFSTDDWIEITDDWHELAGQPGLMRMITIADDATRTITLDQALPAGEFAADANGLAARHTRIRRWDQQGIVRDVNGAQILDLDAATSTGVIPVPVATTSIILEHGVRVTFDTEPTGGEFHVGDYWLFAARTADASVESLDKMPPVGIHHHYCRLALITVEEQSAQVDEDCRPLFPPLTNICAEDVCYDNSNCELNAKTVQEAIEALCQRSGGGCCVCIGQGGDYPTLSEAIEDLFRQGHRKLCLCLLRGGHEVTIPEVNLGDESAQVHITISGCGPGSRLMIRSSTLQFIDLGSVTLQDLAVEVWERAQDEGGIVFQRCREITIANCQLWGWVEKGAICVIEDVDRSLVADNEFMAVGPLSFTPLREFFEEQGADHLVRLLTEELPPWLIELMTRDLARELVENEEQRAITRNAVTRLLELVDSEVVATWWRNNERSSQEYLHHYLLQEQELLEAEELTEILLDVRRSAIRARPGAALVLETASLNWELIRLARVSVKHVAHETRLRGNRIDGSVVLYGMSPYEPAKEEWQEYVLESLLSALGSTIHIVPLANHAGGLLQLTENHLARITIDKELLQLLHHIGQTGSDVGWPTAPRLFRECLIEGNAFETSRNVLVGGRATFANNFFKEPLSNEILGMVIASSGVYLGNQGEGTNQVGLVLYGINNTKQSISNLGIMVI